MKQETLEERIQHIAFLHKQNLNGRETEDELFEAGILAGIEETKERMYSEEEVYHILVEHTAFLFAGGKSTLSDWFEQFKKK